MYIKSKRFWKHFNSILITLKSDVEIQQEQVHDRLQVCQRNPSETSIQRGNQAREAITHHPNGDYEQWERSNKGSADKHTSLRRTDQ